MHYVRANFLSHGSQHHVERLLNLASSRRLVKKRAALIKEIWGEQNRRKRYKQTAIFAFPPHRTLFFRFVKLLKGKIRLFPDCL
jgi:hypothetical protein